MNKALTPYERWQERTKDGRKMAGGWISAKHTPEKEGQYEVRDHPKYSRLTWAHGYWWHLPCDDGVPHWKCLGAKRFTWRRKWATGAPHIHWADLLFKAVKQGSESAAQELRKSGWDGKHDPYLGTYLE